MQLRYVFSELGQGLRRNLSMHVAVILTLFVSLTLVGTGVLLQQQAAKAADNWGNELQITVFLCKDQDENPRCAGEVTDAQKTAIEQVVEENPEVSAWHVESKEQAFEKVKALFEPGKFDGPNSPVTAEAMPESVWITLKDPREFEGVLSAVQGLDGVSDTRDLRDVLKPIYDSISVLTWGAWLISGFLVVAALLLVGNTIRLAAFARRREIGIMRLVGASTLYIALPFLLEALVTAALGVLLAAGALGALWGFGVRDVLASSLGFMPWIGVESYLLSVVVIAVLGPLLTLLPTLVLTRKYLKV
ncbi:permease-like cell division protein FtsX [Nocardioides sp.]|uniref:permease-like cell division protein FtsX n=1 Tax=Nocardioides sp. TaxID=35761 RepID=UPI003D0C0365